MDLANVSQCRKTERGDPLRFFNIHSVPKHEKIEEIFSYYFREKNLTMPKKTERRNPLGFSNIHLSQNIKKMQGGPFEGKKFEKKSEKKCLAVPKKIERGDSLVSPGMVCYAEKQVKPFWSSSLGQMVQFDTIIFCRTFKNYFGQFVWIEKKRVTIIVAFHFMKRRLKNQMLGMNQKHNETRRKRLELVLHVKIKKRKVIKICAGFYEKLKKVLKHKKCSVFAQKRLRIFGYNVLGQMGELFLNRGASSVVKRPPS